jgi:hypothetical protein
MSVVMLSCVSVEALHRVDSPFKESYRLKPQLRPNKGLYSNNNNNDNNNNNNNDHLCDLVVRVSGYRPHFNPKEHFSVSGTHFC